MGRSWSSRRKSSIEKQNKNSIKKKKKNSYATFSPFNTCILWPDFSIPVVNIPIPEEPLATTL
jgi:hypothetical protein